MKHDFKTIRQILNDYFENSNEPLAVAYRDRLFKEIHPNTELGVDLKLFTRALGRMGIGEIRPGAIVRDDEDHFTFFESALVEKFDHAAKRNPHVLELKYINVNRKDDGTLYPTFNRPRYTEELTFQDFCRKAAEELLMVACSFDKLGLVEESKKGSLKGSKKEVKGE